MEIEETMSIDLGPIQESPAETKTGLSGMQVI
jgi:hypothetical protein